MQAKTAVIATVALIAGIGIGVSSPSASAQDQKAGQKQTMADFPDLVAGLKATPGCIEVKQAILPGGKMTIFAWFENKAAVNAWYMSPMHQGVMKKFFPNMPGNSEAIHAFKDEESPLLVVATITPSQEPTIAGSSLAISQIAIEIYTPVPGGIAIGGGFGPDSLKVPGLRRITMSRDGVATKS